MDTFKIVFHLTTLCAACIIVSTYTLYNPSVLPFSEWRTAVEPYPANNMDNLFWFVQISDTHLSRYYDPQRAPDLKDFCNSTLGIIDPDVVLVTGDLTDAKSKNKYGSKQFEDEWQAYQSILRETEVTKKFWWLDIRGNHDAFDVARVDDPNSNYYLKYSGDKGKLTSKVFHLVKPFGTYSFIPVDATMVPGPRRPYNFVGYLTKERMEKLKRFQRETSKSNYTIWYSHYPTSSITSHDPGLRSLVGLDGGAYLAGHLHTLGGLTDTMYAMNPRGFLELELADWKYERAYRIVAVDHDMLSFTDMAHKQWPAVVLTNPKAAEFMLPHVEPIRRIRESTHVRFLIFDPWKIQNVTIHIDNFMMPDTPYQVSNSPLWVCRWDSKKYLTGMHTISVKVTDSEGNTNVLSQEFSLYTTWTPDFGRLAPFVLLTDFSTLFLIGFYMTSFSYTCGIIFFRFYHHNPMRTHMIAKISTLLKDGSMFTGTLVFALNIMWGPWFAGNLLKGTIGVCFPFGMLIDGEVLPEHMLYLNGIQKIVIFYIPAIFFLAHFNYAPDRRSRNNLQRALGSPLHSLLIAYTIYILLRIYSLWGLYESYGLMAAIVSPFELWWTCFILYKTWHIYMHKPINDGS